MTPKQMIRIALVAGLCLLVVVGAGVYEYNRFCAPRNSILALASAMQRRDRETVEEYVDAPALAESFRKRALELFQREMTKKKSDDFINRLLNPLGEELARGIAGAVFTPDVVISMLCDDDPKEAMKESLGNSSDKTVDGFTDDGGLKIRVYGAVGKVLIRWAAGYVIDEAAEKAKQGEMDPSDYDVAAQYESPNRYLITMTHRNSDDATIGWVFKRHGLATWKLSEMRLLAREKK